MAAGHSDGSATNGYEAAPNAVASAAPGIGSSVRPWRAANARARRSTASDRAATSSPWALSARSRSALAASQASDASSAADREHRPRQPAHADARRDARAQGIRCHGKEVGGVGTRHAVQALRGPLDRFPGIPRRDRGAFDARPGLARLPAVLGADARGGQGQREHDGGTRSHSTADQRPPRRAQTAGAPPATDASPWLIVTSPPSTRAASMPCADAQARRSSSFAAPRT